MKHIAGLILLLFLSLFSGCERGGDARLARADVVIESRPDYALDILDSINPATLGAERDKALYGLLMTQAQIKNNIMVSDDSLIAPACRYFEDNGPDFDRMRALFYEARVLYNVPDYPSSMKYALPAYDIAVILGDDYWRAKTAEILSDLYSASQIHREAIPYNKEAVEYYQKAGKIPNHRYSLADLAITIGNIDEHERSIELLDSVLAIARTEPVDSILIGYCEKALVHFHAYKDDYETAYPIAADILEHRDIYVPVSRDYSDMALVFPDTARMNLCLSLAEELATTVIDTAGIYVVKEMIHHRAGRYEEAYAYMDSILDIQNVGVSEVLMESVLVTQRDLLDLQAEMEKERAERLWMTVVFGAVFFVTVVSLLVYIYNIRMKNSRLKFEQTVGIVRELSDKIEAEIEERQRLEVLMADRDESIVRLNSTLEEKQHSITELNARISEKESRIAGLKHDVETLYRSQWHTLNTLCKEYSETDESESALRKLRKKIDKEIGRLRSPGNIRELEKAVNRHMDNIIARLRSQCRRLKPEDIDFLTLVYAGFSAKMVCLLANVGSKNYYTKKARLIARIESSDAADKDFFLERLVAEHPCSFDLL